MKNIFLGVIIFLSLIQGGGMLFIALFLNMQINHKIFYFLASLPGWISFYYVLSYHCKTRKVTSDFHKDILILYGENDFYREIKHDEIKVIQFASIYEFTLEIVLINQERLTHRLKGLGLKEFTNFENWWGQKIIGHHENKPLARILFYKKLLDKLLRKI